jgi:hypothetical protein
MGLLDILSGMQNGPRGQQQPTKTGSSGGMSPIMKAVLGMLAYKALKGSSGQGAAPGGIGHPVPLPPRGNINVGNAGGGLGDILGGLLGGKPVPAASGAKPSGGLGDLLGGLLSGTAAGSVLSGVSET